MEQKRRFEVRTADGHSASVVADGFRLADGDLAFHTGKGGNVELTVAFARGQWDWVVLDKGEAV